jgi:hypothetical protein
MAVWLGLLLLAIANGAFRVSVLNPLKGEPVGHILSTLMLSAIILFMGWWAISFIRPASEIDAWKVGLLWVGSTLAFEFLAGHYLFGHSWSRLLADYDVLRGRVWILVLLATFLAPVAGYRLRRGGVRAQT